ncbi:stalk domain-containing protein [Thermosediminibacter litoriperuensis]|uniref:Spore germination protein YaaH n=1 Tax=Thermosediminibacter litoriperuensis TaxID=291989 RepID=A0A5S5AMN8_9FIRM|nr:stalk domain-containing protein [Thermosediminibacter litoriperuensis]TYP52442.1 spore germination protein YaaH [Thermosediminibacter litoriperuensis]
MLKRRFAVSVLLVAIMLTIITPLPASAAASIRVMLNGQDLKFDVTPVLKNNRVLVPFRLLSENLGAGVHWDGRTKTVTAHRGETRVVLRVGSSTAYVNEKPVKLDVPAMLIQGRTLVPLRFYSEAFGAAVHWDGKQNTVFIKTADKLSKYILGYYYSQSYDDFMNNVDKLSSIAAKWYTLDSNCNLTSRDNSRWIMKPEGYDSVLRTARERGVKVHALVFESDRARLQQALATAEKRSALVSQIIAEVEKENYDGVNIDFEYLRLEDKENYNEFIKQLYTTLKSKKKTLSLSLPAKTEKKDWWPGYDYETLGKYSDYVVLMAYDKNPASPGPQAGIDWVEEIVDYALARIPAGKIVLGIGYYGYAWSGSEKYTVLEAKNGMTYSKIWFLDELTQKHGLKLTIDSASLMAYGSFTDEKGKTYQIWMESRESVDAKSRLAIKKGLKGIAVWRLGYTTPSFWQAVNDSFIAAK